MELEVHVKCEGAILVALDELQEMHHFKTQTDTDYVKLRNVLIERGFKFPFTIWIDEAGTKWTVDGRSRLKTLKRMRDENVKLPDRFPANLIGADTKEDAAKDIIASESKFADINEGDFTEFLSDYNIDWDSVDAWANIPEGVSESKEEKPTTTQSKEVECPSCQFKFIPSATVS